jgi:tetratricopeptide (TPR) repeat protein
LSGLTNSHIRCNGLISTLIQQGDKELKSHQYDKAEMLYLQCLYHVGIMHESKLRLAICSLYKGNAEKSLEWIVPLVKCILEIYKASDPDPVEWAYFIISLLCLGKVEEAKKRCNEFPSLCHIELDRVHWVVNLLTETNSQHVSLSYSQVSRASVHHLPNQDLNEWTKSICLMLKACGQLSLANKLEAFPLANQPLELRDKSLSNSAEEKLKPSDTTQNTLFEVLPKSLKSRNSKIFTRTEFRKKLLNKARKIGHKLLSPLNSLEVKFGYFLPFPISAERNDEFFSIIKELIEKEDVKTILLIGVTLGKGMTDSVLYSAQENLQDITVFCINRLTSQYIKLQERYRDNSILKFYELPLKSADIHTVDIENCIDKIKLDNRVDCFDMVLVDISEMSFDVGSSVGKFCESRFLILEDINTLQGYQEYHYLSSATTYILESQNPGLRGGFAIFRKSN